LNKGVSAGSLREIFVPNPTIECRLPHRNFGEPQMPPASRTGVPAFSAAGSILGKFFTAILGSLHKSRQRQARRIVREQRHLIAAAARREVTLRKSPSEGHEHVSQ
jgi:hypothetical protein